MSDPDLERAIAAALKAGLKTAEEIAAFAQQWLEPMVHAELREPLVDNPHADEMTFRVVIARPTGAMH